MAEQYQGYMRVYSQQVMSSDMVYFAPSQEKEFNIYLKEGRLPDGRTIQDHKWYSNVTDRRTLLTDMLTNSLEEQRTLSVGLEELDLSH